MRHSSTSSSELRPLSTSHAAQRIPARTGRAYLVVAALVFVLCLVASEVSLRGIGYVPHVQDTHELWSLHRSRAAQGRGFERVVIVGASRAQLGLDPRILRESLPDTRFTLLAIGGGSGYLPAVDLMNDPEFRGVLVWSTVAPWMGPTFFDKRSRRRLDAHHTLRASGAWVGAYAEAWLRAEVESRLVSSQLEPMLRSRLVHEQVVLPYIHMRSDRYQPADHTRFDAVGGRHHRAGGAPWHGDQEHRRPWARSPESFRAHLDDEVMPAVRRLVARGGQVVILRMPTTGRYWEEDELAYPRALWWDRIPKLRGLHTIHFRDHPRLAALTSVDGHHLDYRDARVASSVVGELLRGIAQTGR